MGAGAGMVPVFQVQQRERFNALLGQVGQGWRRRAFDLPLEIGDRNRGDADGLLLLKSRHAGTTGGRLAGNQGVVARPVIRLPITALLGLYLVQQLPGPSGGAGLYPRRHAHRGFVLGLFRVGRECCCIVGPVLAFIDVLALCQSTAGRWFLLSDRFRWHDKVN